MKGVLIILASALVAIILLILFIFLSIRRNINWFSSSPMEGKFADFHGRKIYYRVKGKGDPAIVVFGAMGSSQAEWWPIQNDIGIYYRMITWDRAGYGWSSPIDELPSAAVVTEELNNLLKFERVKKPVLIVAHGTGTLYARYYATKYPDKVTGALFIDPFPLNYKKWLEGANEIEDFPNLPAMATRNKLKAGKGYFRIFSPFKGYRLDKRYKRDMIEHYSRTENYDTLQTELSQVEGILEEIKEAGDFPNIPLRVLYPGNESLIRDWVRRGISEYSARQKGRLHQGLIKDILSLSQKSSMYEIEGSGEFIHLSKPDIVTKEILDMMKA